MTSAALLTEGSLQKRALAGGTPSNFSLHKPTAVTHKTEKGKYTDHRENRNQNALPPKLLPLFC